MEKASCEICNYAVRSALHGHHIIPISEPDSTNYSSNLVVVCANCHNEIHAGDKIIEGRFMTTSGLKLFWRNRGDQPIITEGKILRR